MEEKDSMAVESRKSDIRVAPNHEVPEKAGHRSRQKALKKINDLNCPVKLLIGDVPYPQHTITDNANPGRII